MVEEWHHPVRQVAQHFGITSARVYQLRAYYRKYGEYPQLKKRGRKSRVISEQLRQGIIGLKLDLNLGSYGMASYLRSIRGIKIGSTSVHRVLLEEGLTEKDPSKSVRRHPWVRYEREHSLSAVHMDWYLCSDSVTWVCAVLDDASCMILSGGEFSAATAENSINLLREAYEEYQHIAPIREVITDHGSQFYANKRDLQGNAEHSFELFCKEMGIQHILARIKHPQTNGKMERWFQTYAKNRQRFEDFEEFVWWYNCRRPHQSLKWEIMETPYNAFYRKSVDLIRGNCVHMIARIMEEQECV